MFYKIDSTRVTLREWSWYGGLLTGVIGKIFRVQNPSSTDDPPVDSVVGLEIDELSLPIEVFQVFAAQRTELEAAGFHSPVFQALHHPLIQTDYYWASFRHTSNETIARLTCRTWNRPTPARTSHFVSYLSRFADGGWVVSTSSKPDLLVPPKVAELRIKGAATADLWKAHTSELARAKVHRQLVPVDSDDAMRQTLELFHSEIRNFHLARGVFAAPTPADLAQAEGMARARAQAVATGSQFPEIHAELDALQQRQSSWSSGLVLLIVSLVLFAGAGGLRGGWKFALLIIPVLLIHELGHYVAMRVFQYRNLKMFFIPFFGAAVSGSNYNVPGWKKVIVSLMGPVPGILLGMILGGAGIYFHIDWLNKFALLMIGVNGFNLLPILPLDGGWVLHTLLFSRHAALDCAFRVIAALGLAAWGINSHDRIMMYLAIPMAMGIPAALKMARISTKLRREQLPELSADSQTIPFLTAERIISEVKAEFPKGLTTKTTAQNTLHIFETINAHPPGWIATVFYLFVHAGVFAVGFVCMGFLVIAQRGELGRTFGLAELQRGIPIRCETLASGGSPVGPSPSGESHTFAATLKTEDQARSHLMTIAKLSGTDAQARTLGRSVLVSFSSTNEALRKKLLASTEPLSTNVFIQSKEFSLPFTLACQAPTEGAAKDIETSGQRYLTAAMSMSLIPVWMPKLPVSAEEWEKAQLARGTYLRLLHSSSGYLTNRSFAEINRQISGARRRGDGAMVKRLTEDSRKLAEKLQKDDQEAVGAEAQIDPEIVKLFRQWSRTYATNEAQAEVLQQLAARMGQMQMEAAKKPLREQAIYAARWGAISREGSRLSFTISFEDLYYGAPALLDWLCKQGCSEMKYTLQGAVETEEEERE